MEGSDCLELRAAAQSVCVVPGPLLLQALNTQQAVMALVQRLLLSCVLTGDSDPDWLKECGTAACNPKCAPE